MKITKVFRFNLVYWWFAPFFIMIACVSGDFTENPDKFDWKLVWMVSEDPLFGGYASNYYLLSFDKEEGVANLQLDVNQCWAAYEITDHQISFDNFSCTRICCDSNYAIDLAEALSGSGFEWDLGQTDLLLTEEKLKLYFRRY